MYTHEIFFCFFSGVGYNYRVLSLLPLLSLLLGNNIDNTATTIHYWSVAIFGILLISNIVDLVQFWKNKSKQVI
jgi:hypothetical protein